jgi:hypothetical protein
VVEVDLASSTCSHVIDGFPSDRLPCSATCSWSPMRGGGRCPIDLSGGRGVFRLQLSADIERPDSVYACGDDAVLVTSTEDETGIGTVRRIGLDGSTAIVAQGPWEPRGVVCDGQCAYVATRRSGVLVFDL